MAIRSSMRLSIAYDSEALRGFEPGWGFSAILSVENVNILFDCGWDGHVLRRNLGRLGYNLADIHMVFLSHSHWDHIGGLPEVLQDVAMGDTLNVVLHDGFSQNLRKEIGRKAMVTEVKGPREIAPGIWSTGALGKDIKEHALLACVGDGGLLLTGCAHPGIREVVFKAREIAPVTWLVGGFHDASLADLPADLRKVVPCHCTRRKRDMASVLPRAVELGAARMVLVFP
ncbi:MAG: MBL fold metallo-hydrolase [Thermoplasmata archaeon]